MVILKIKRNRCVVNVIFTGAQFVFYNDFYGLLAVATRKGDTPEERNVFDIFYGNAHTIGGRFGGEYCFTMAKAFVSKYEKLYKEKDLTFIPHHENIQTWNFDISAAPQKR